jgi:hypothetical protein
VGGAAPAGGALPYKASKNTSNCFVLDLAGPIVPFGKFRAQQMCSIQAGIQAGQPGAAGNKTGQGRMSKHVPVTRGHVPSTKAKMPRMTGLVPSTTE